MKKQNLKKLTKVWYDKLRDSGFKDVERLDGRLNTADKNNSPLHDEYFSSQGGKDRSSLVWKESVQEYYRLASQFLFDKDFEDSIDKTIWEYHSQGLTHKEVAKKLGMGATANSVRFRVYRMRKAFY